MRVRDTIFKASAGTGKTFQVTRLYEALVLGHEFRETVDGDATPAVLVKEGEKIPCSRILMLTFANDAAAEMRMRIVPRVEEALARAAGDEEIRFLWNVLKALPAANISTIHSFAQKLLSENAIEAGISPGWTVMEERDAEQLFEELMRQQLLELLGGGDAELKADMQSLCAATGVGRMVEAAIGLAGQLRSRGVELDGRDPAGLVPEPVLPDAAELDGIVKTMSDLAKVVNLGTGGAKCLEMLAKAAEVAKRGKAGQLAATCEEGCPSRGWGTDERVKAIRKTAGAMVGRIKNHPAHLRARTLTIGFLRYTGLGLARFEREKLAQGALDFDDMIIKANALVSRRKDCTPEFDVIIVDEAQDNSPIQNEFIDRIRENNGASLILCGDRKQSIYTWRNADPEGMEKLARRMKDPLNVPLHISYRSQKDLIDWINSIAAHGSVFGDGYGKGERLSVSARAKRTKGPNVELLLPDWEFGKDPMDTLDVGPSGKNGETDKPAYQFQITGRQLRNRSEENPLDKQARQWAGQFERRQTLEARAVARRIKLLCAGEKGIAGWKPPFAWDHLREDWSGGASHRYRDVLILLRATTNQSAYEAALHELGIRYTTGGKGRGFFYRQEVKDIASLLGWLAFPADPVALAAVARSPFIGLSDPAIALLSRDEAGKMAGAQLCAALTAAGDGVQQCEKTLAEAGLNDDERAYGRGRLMLERLRALAGRVSGVELVREAIHISGYDAVLAGAFHGVQKLANMRKLLSLIHDTERRNEFDLQALSLWLSGEIEKTSAPDAVVFDPADDAVRISTVHSAKGLTSPVVFLPGLGYKPRSSSGGHIVQGEGDPAVAAKIRELADESGLVELETSDYQERNEAEKEKRRAEGSRLFYVAITRPRDLIVLSGPNSTNNARSWRGDLNDYLADELAAGRKPAQKVTIRSFGEVGAAFGRTKADDSALKGVPSPAAIEECGRRMKKPEAGEEYRLPVTALVKAAAANGSVDDIREYRRTALVGLSPEWMSARRESGGGAGIDYAEIGTIGHEVLETFDFKAAGSVKERVREALERLSPQAVDTARLKDRIAEAIEYLGAELRNVQQDAVIREMPFSARFEHDGAKCIVDGQMDLVFFDGEAWRIVDYKFVNLGADGLMRRYALQLQVYAAAFRESALVAGMAGGQTRKIRMTILGIGDRRVLPVDVDPEDDATGEVIRIARMIHREMGDAIHRADF